MKKLRYQTDSEVDLTISKYLCIFAGIVCIFYTARGLFMGETIGKGIIRSWVSGWGIVILIFVLVMALIYFIMGLPYYLIKKKVLRNGTMHQGNIVSEIEKRHAHKGAVWLTWKYVIKTEDGSTYTSVWYFDQITERKCTVCVLGERCIITDIQNGL